MTPPLTCPPKPGARRPTCSLGHLKARVPRDRAAPPHWPEGVAAARLRSDARGLAPPRPRPPTGGGGAGGRDDVTGWGGARAGEKGERAAVSVLAPPARQPGRRAHAARRWRSGSAWIPCNSQDVKRGRAGEAQPSQPPGKGGTNSLNYPQIAGTPAGSRRLRSGQRAGFVPGKPVLHGHCARRTLRCSRLHAQSLRRASCVRTMPRRAGPGGGDWKAELAGWGASPRRGRGLGWTRPERGVGSCPAPPAAPPRAAGGAKARSGDARVCGECWHGPGTPGGSWRQGSLCWGGGRSGTLE